MTAPATTSTDPALAPAFAAAGDVCRRNARGLYLASFFLPPAKRDALRAAFAFAHMIDEAIDVPDPAALAGAGAMRHHPAVASPARSALPVLQPQQLDAQGSACAIDTADSRLAMLRERLDEIYAGRLELPAPASRSQPQHALHAFAETVGRYRVPKQYFLDLAEGRRRELAPGRFETWQELENFCHLRGGAMGLIVGSILGLTHSEAFAQAATMGAAVRLTTLLRDVKRDWDQGRLFLPREDLRRFGYGEQDLARGVVDARFRALMKFQVERARQLYREAAEGICWLAGDGSRVAASSIAVVHAGVLDAIERSRYDVLTRRAQLTTPRMLAGLPRAWRLARRDPDLPLPDVF